MTLTVIHAPEFGEWTFGDGHPLRSQRFLNVMDNLHRVSGLDLNVVPPRTPSSPELERVHSRRYVAEVWEGWSDEWEGRQPALGRLAALSAGGSLKAAELVWRGPTRRAINFAGGMHHAQESASGGFCVFNDVALAASWLTRRRLRVAIVDFDAHHGDGTENLLRANSDVLTFSVHDASIFPGTGKTSFPADHAYNVPLSAHSGSGELFSALSYASELVRGFSPDVLLVLAGVDGYVDDPLSTLTYSLEDFYDAGAIMSALADEVTGGRIIALGAGGYLPDDWTPACWTAFAMGLEFGPRPRPILTGKHLRLVTK